MPSDLTIPLESVYAFVLVLIRVTGVLTSFLSQVSRRARRLLA